MDQKQIIYSNRNTDVSTLEWLFIHFILLVPIVNFMALLYWSFSSKTKVSKQTYARSLIFATALVAMGLLVFYRIGAFEGVQAGWIGDVLSQAASKLEESDSKPRIRYREFTDTSGRKIRAKVVKFAGSAVIIERRDGEIFELDINRFSDEDRAYLIELRSELNQ